MNSSAAVALYIDDEEGVRRCYPVMAQLRPHLASEDEFVARWRRQASEGYRLLALCEGLRVVAVAGYRVQENLVHGRFLYVDDLVTAEALRGGGYGERLMTRLKHEAGSLGCGKLLLDTAMSNSPGQRFYLRNGLLATALRFSTGITGFVRKKRAAAHTLGPCSRLECQNATTSRKRPRTR